jgi:hypothetical protein
LSFEVNPRSATQMMRPGAQSRMSFLTWRISAESAVFPGQHHTRRDPLPGDRQPDHDLRQVIAGVLELAVLPEPGRVLIVSAAGARMVRVLLPRQSRAGLAGLAGLEITG